MASSVNPHLVMRELLASNAGSAMAEIDSRVYAHVLPAENHNLPACILDLTSGISHPQIPIYNPAFFTIKIYDARGEFANCRRIYNLLRDGIHGTVNVATASGRVIYCLEEQPGQELTDFDTEYACVMSQWRVAMAAQV